MSSKGNYGWWRKAFAVLMSSAMIATSTPVPALAEEGEAPAELVEVAEGPGEEKIVPEEEVVEQEIADPVEDVVIPEDGEEAVLPEADESEEADVEDEQAIEAVPEEEADAAEPEEDLGLETMSAVSSIGSVTLSRTEFAYTGAAIRPNPVVKGSDGTKLVKGVDYTLKWTNNKKVGTASVTAMGIGNYSGEKKAYFKIIKRNISSATATVGTRFYTGAALKPTPTVRLGKVTLKRGADYRVIKYTNNRNAGTASVTIRGINNVYGTRTIKFRIRYNVAPRGAIEGYYRIGSHHYFKFVFVKTGAVMKSGRDYSITTTTYNGQRVYLIVGRNRYIGRTIIPIP